MRLNIFNAGTFIPSEGIAQSAKCAIVGEYPNIHEVRAGKVFGGATGQVLQSCLASADLIRGECYLTYVIKDLDRPVAERYDFKRRQFDMAGQEYVALLKQEMLLIDSPFILAAGELALYALTGRHGIYQWRGSVLECTLVPGKYVIPILPPSSVNPPKCVYINKYLIQYDVQRMGRLIEKGSYEPYQYHAHISPTFEEITHYLHKLKSRKLVAFDIEVKNEEVSCISFCDDPHYAMSVPFIDQEQDMWTPSQELAIWLLIAEILEDPHIGKLGQNLAFDAHFLLSRYGIATHSMHDTMVAQNTICPDFKKGLDFITSVHTDMPYHKGEGKAWFKVGGQMEEFWNYNALDSLTCFVAYPSQLKALTDQGNMETYDRQRTIIEPLVYLEEHGIKADIVGINKMRGEMESEIDIHMKELHRIAGCPLNPNSPKQLVDYFYTTKRYPMYRKKGKPTTDDLAMKRLIRKGSQEAKVIQKIRKLKKLSSTYLDPDKFDDDGRIRASYNPAGTRYSRISSGSNIFGSGMNLQNWPHQLQKFLMADDDYVGYAMDLSQAENRIVAYVGKIASMIQAFVNKDDVHSLTGSLIFGDSAEEIKRDANLKIKCSLGDGTHTKRDWGKKANHGLNYGFSYQGFSVRYEMPERDSKFIYDGYHGKYPGVQQGFHKHVKRQLRTDRTVTNLYGRKVLFLGQLDNQTYNEAYACIPQSTVGDIINERGMSYIYYNPDLFGPVELLNQVHDEILFQIPSPTHPTNPITWEEHARIIKLIKRSLEVTLTAHGVDFVVPVDTTLFMRMKKGIDISSSDIDAPTTDVAKMFERTWYDVVTKTLMEEYDPEPPKPHYGKKFNIGTK